MARIRTMAPMVPKSDGRTVAAEQKRADPHYLSSAHERWRAQVLDRAGRRCEWVEDGYRCVKADPLHRMFANHIKERRDGGDPLDPQNGNCLCGSHHTQWTLRQRAKRIGVGG